MVWQGAEFLYVTEFNIHIQLTPRELSSNIGNLQFQASTHNFSDTKTVMPCSSLAPKVRIDEQCNHTVYKILLRQSDPRIRVDEFVACVANTRIRTKFFFPENINVCNTWQS